MGYGVFLYPLDGSKKKFFRVCNLVVKMFLPGGEGKVIHRDLDEQNNHLMNLTWSSFKNNSRLTPELSQAIIRDRVEKKLLLSQLSHKYMLSTTTICKALKNDQTGTI
jgi:hypothetical protein